MLLLCTMQLLEIAWYTLWDRTCSILYSKHRDTFYLWPIRDLGLGSALSTNKSTWSAHGNKTWLERGKSSDVIWSMEQMEESLLNLYDTVFIVRILHFGGNNLYTNSAWNMLLDLVCKLTRIMMQKVAWYKYRDTCFAV